MKLEFKNSKLATSPESTGVGRFFSQLGFPLPYVHEQSICIEDQFLGKPTFSGSDTIDGVRVKFQDIDLNFDRLHNSIELRLIVSGVNKGLKEIFKKFMDTKIERGIFLWEFENSSGLIGTYCHVVYPEPKPYQGKILAKIFDLDLDWDRPFLYQVPFDPQSGIKGSIDKFWAENKLRGIA